MKKSLAYIAICLAVMVNGSPAFANWANCYVDDVPAGLNRYPEYPPRSVRFERFVLPQTFKRLCALPADTETKVIRELVANVLQCSVESDLAQRIDGLLTAPVSEIFQSYFKVTSAPSGPEWDAVCEAASAASIQNLSYGNSWYFDSDVPESDWARFDALLEALRNLSASLEGGDNG